MQATCVGAQVYYAPTNECTEPRCKAYFFQEVDEATQLCRVVSACGGGGDGGGEGVGGIQCACADYAELERLLFLYVRQRRSFQAPVWRTLGIVAVTVFALAELGIYIAQVKVSRTAMRVTGRAPAVYVLCYPPASAFATHAVGA